MTTASRVLFLTMLRKNDDYRNLFEKKVGKCLEQRCFKGKVLHEDHDCRDAIRFLKAKSKETKVFIFFHWTCEKKQEEIIATFKNQLKGFDIGYFNLTLDPKKPIESINGKTLPNSKKFEELLSAA